MISVTFKGYKTVRCRFNHFFWQGACARGHFSRCINHFKARSFMNLDIAYYTKRIKYVIMRKRKLHFTDKL